MDWFGAGVNVPLIAVRAIHFGATALTAGTVVFRTVVAKPALDAEPAAKLVRTQTLRVAWIGLAVTALSGVVWLLLQTVSMSGLPAGEAMTGRVLWTVLDQTQFGLVEQIRSLLAIVLAVCLAIQRPWTDWLGFAAALGLTAAIAWTGHAGSTLGAIGDLHVTADALHLLAAAAWIGGLVPLVLLLAAVRRHPTVAWTSQARDVTRRFSTLGTVSVATLMASGIVNAWILVGSVHGLLVTEYGRLLMLKLGVFAIMLVFAAMNRFWLTPRLALSAASGAQLDALRQLTRNSTIEIGLGVIIFAIVGMLGTLHPATHFL
ncbi:MAG TPA: copper homeostasis membrane protein CopD [Bradyrhizobium sp.]|nr:copper homeostasis membrane protein CopD [Bradyrhizobium sp.]